MTLHQNDAILHCFDASIKTVPISSVDTTSNYCMQVNIYMGLGLLSMPYAMKLAGWCGVLSLMAASLTFCLSAKLLIHAFKTLPPGVPHTYANLGQISYSKPLQDSHCGHHRGRCFSCNILDFLECSISSVHLWPSIVSSSCWRLDQTMMTTVQEQGR